jgi:hypothetical protein
VLFTLILKGVAVQVTIRVFERKKMCVVELLQLKCNSV